MRSTASITLRDTSPARPHGGRPRGFSLLELVAVLVIVAVVMGMVAPSLRGFAQGQQTAQAARQVLATIQWAQQRAIAEGRPWRFHLDGQRGELWLTVQEGAAFVDPARSEARRTALATQVSARWQTPPVGDAEHALLIEPSGRTEPATIRLTGRLGAVYLVTSPAADQPFHVVQTQAENQP